MESTRERSIWAWGWRDKFPDEAARKGIGQLVQMMAPAVKPAARALPSDTPAVPDAAVDVPDVLAAFATQAPRDRASHARGRAFVDLVAGFDTSRRTTGSEYRHFIASNSTAITQDNTLNQTTLSAGLRWTPTGRGRSISRFAFIPRRLAPYVGGGVSAGYHRFSQTGQFVDYTDLSIFNDRFTTSGWTFGPYVHGGADVQMWKRLYLTIDGRYSWMHGSLSSDFQGFDGIDLAGFRWSTGISVVM